MNLTVHAVSLRRLAILLLFAATSCQTAPKISTPADEGARASVNERRASSEFTSLAAGLANPFENGTRAAALIDRNEPLYPEIEEEPPLAGAESESPAVVSDPRSQLERIDELAQETRSSGSETREELLEALSEEELLAELQGRVLRGWQVVSNELPAGEGLQEEVEALRQQTARKVMALGFLWEGSEPGEGLASTLEAAAESLEHSPADAASRLLAAAHMAQNKKTPEMKKLLSRFHEQPAGTAPRDDPDDGYQIVNLTFASGIEGPGEYCSLPASQVKPGEAVLIYGEFKNFEVERNAGRAPEGGHLCSFAATCQLLDDDGGIRDEVEFLSAEHGEQHLTSLSETVNFWVRYNIPEDLKPGSYGLRIHAKDLVGKSDASGELEFRVPRAR